MLTRLISTKPRFWKVVLSTLAAAFGVQSRKNHEDDFKHGSIAAYILAGIIFTVLFVFAVIWVVGAVLANSGL